MYFYYTFLPCFCQYTISYYANYILCIQLRYNFRHIFTDISYLSDRLLSVPCSSYNPVTKSLFYHQLLTYKKPEKAYTFPGFGNLHQFRQDLQLICKAQPVSVSAHNEPLQLPQMQQRVSVLSLGRILSDGCNVFRCSGNPGKNHHLA